MTNCRPERLQWMNIMTRHTLLAIAVLCTAGCLPNAFAPPPDDYELFVKPGVDEVTIWKDMLECNLPSPSGNNRQFAGAERTFDESAGALICMERLGYGVKEEWRVRPVCKSSGWKVTQPCVTGVGIPVPNRERRLSSGYCKAYPKSRACEP